MGNFTRSVILGLGLVAALPAFAQSQAERLARLMSKDFAQQAAASLMRGDRPAAIDLVLRGFPADPTQEDMAAYPEAYFVLEIAAGTRMTKIDQDGAGFFSVNSDGTRAFAGHYDSRPHMDTRYFPQSIIDPRDGSLIRELAPQIEVHGLTTPGRSPSFSPDGSVLAIPSNATLSVHLFAAEDGAYIRELKPGFEIARNHGSSYWVGFSEDGAQFALGYAAIDKAGILLWNVADGALLGHLPMSADPKFRQRPLGWDHEGGFVVQSVHRESSKHQPHRIDIERWALDGGRRTIVDANGIVYDGEISAFTFPGVPLILLSDEARMTALDMETGQVRFQTQVQHPQVALVRDGAAFAMGREQLTSAEDVRVYDFDGNPLAPRGRDLIPFTHVLLAKNGSLIGYSTGPTRTTYAGHDLPEGVALYEAVWGGLTEAERGAIDQDRVIRP